MTSVSDTRIRASSSCEVTNTVRATDDSTGVVTSSVVSAGPNCRNEAWPPIGWFSMRSRYVFTNAVAFSATTTKARWNPLNDLLLPGADTNRPSVTRAV